LDCASGRAHSFARALCGVDAISLSFHKEMAKEKELGRSLRGLPSRAKTESASGLYIFAEINKFRFCARILIIKCEHGRRTQDATAKKIATCDAHCDSRNFKQDATAKILANADPSAGWDICPADGGILQKQKNRRLL
jgi:hypothetical protein